MSLIKPPLQILVLRSASNRPQLQLSSIDEPTSLDVSSSHYADLISFDNLIDAPEVDERVKLLSSTSLLDKVRSQTESESIGVLLLHLYEDTVFLVVDDEREVNVEVVNTHVKRTT